MRLGRLVKIVAALWLLRWALLQLAMYASRWGSPGSEQGDLPGRPPGG